MTLQTRTPYVRLMKMEDLSQVVAIEEMSFSDPWSARSFHELICHPHYSSCPVLVDPKSEWIERVAGFMVLWFLNPEVHIADIAIHPDLRGQGWGKKMIQTALYLGKKWQASYFLLEVRESNQVARCLYEGLGFEQVAIRKAYYSHPKEDALILRRSADTNTDDCPLPILPEVLEEPREAIC